MEEMDNSMSNGAAICYFAIGTLLALALPVVLKVGAQAEETNTRKQTTE